MLLLCCCCCCRCRAPTSSQHTNANENVNSTTTATLTTTTTTTTWQRRRRFTDEWIAEFVWAPHEARQSRSECAHRIKANASADYSSDCDVNADVDADVACAAPESRSDTTRSLHSMRMRSFCSLAQSLTHSNTHSLTHSFTHFALCGHLTAHEHVKHFTFTCKQTVIAHKNCEPESFL